jgi:hypothetical protein
LVQGFQRRRFKCESLRRTTDAKWWQKLIWPLARWVKKAHCLDKNYMTSKYTLEIWKITKNTQTKKVS